MSCGRIVIATRTGGSPEIIDHGVNGFLCAPDDANAMAECLGSVLAKLEKLSPLCLAAREKAVHCFSIGRMCAGYNDLLGELGLASGRVAVPVAAEAAN
jgi:glycosyltransferase involved in cell wall biosynthesis